MPLAACCWRRRHKIFSWQISYWRRISVTSTDSTPSPVHHRSSPPCCTRWFRFAQLRNFWIRPCNANTMLIVKVDSVGCAGGGHWVITSSSLVIVSFNSKPTLTRLFLLKNKSSQRPQGKSGVDSESVSRPDYLQNSTGTSLSKDTSVIKFSWKSDHFSGDIKPYGGNMSYLANLKNPFKNSWIHIRKADDLQNLIRSSLTTDTYICGKSFVKIRSVVF